MSSSNSPCAACKFLRRKCTQECDFAPYFPPDNPQRFACVHRVFGASNVAKLLKELSPTQRDDAVKSLAYEAEARLRDPVYGCVGYVSVLQQRLRQIQHELQNAKKELGTYINSPQAMQYLLENPGAVLMPQHHQNNNQLLQGSNPFTLFPNYPNNLPPQTVMAGGGQLVIRDVQQEQELLEAQQLVAAQQLRNFEQHQQQQEFLRFSTAAAAGGGGGGGGFGHQMGVPVHADVAPSLALGTFGNGSGYQIQQQGEQQQQQHVLHHPPIEAQLLLSPDHSSQQPPHQQQSETEDGRSVGPSY